MPRAVLQQSVRLAQTSNHPLQLNLANSNPAQRRLSVVSHSVPAHAAGLASEERQPVVVGNADMSLYRNINKRKKAGTSRSKKKSTISAKAYANMKAGFPKKGKKKKK